MIDSTARPRGWSARRCGQVLAQAGRAARGASATRVSRRTEPAPASSLSERSSPVRGASSSRPNVLRRDRSQRQLFVARSSAGPARGCPRTVHRLGALRARSRKLYATSSAPPPSRVARLPLGVPFVRRARLLRVRGHAYGCRRRGRARWGRGARRSSSRGSGRPAATWSPIVCTAGMPREASPQARAPRGALDRLGELVGVAAAEVQPVDAVGHLLGHAADVAADHGPPVLEGLQHRQRAGSPS